VSLYLAEMFPNSKITAFSNSRTQKIHIDEVAKEKGFGNLRVITGDVKDYEFEHDAFDRVVSVEMIGESAFVLSRGRLVPLTHSY
jgi:cyclopropane fatty-acyl-phospholipid synthase-like methyltransferase